MSYNDDCRRLRLIKTFKHKGLRQLFETGSKKGIPAQYADKLARILDAIDAATHPLDLDVPGYDLHELQGLRQRTWASKLTGNWRVTFRFRDGDAYDVDLEDYH